MIRNIPNLQQITEEIVDCVKRHNNHRIAVVTALGVSLIYHVANTVTVYCFLLAADSQVDFVPLIFITTLVAMLTMIPISINGIGLQEASYVVGLEYIGIAGPAALLIAVLARVGLVVQSLFGGLLFLVDNGSRKAAVNLAE